MKTLIDAGPIVAYYDCRDDWHCAVQNFLGQFRGQLVTTIPVITEAMWLLRSNINVQNELLSDIYRELYDLEHLQPKDFSRMQELNTRYSNVPADFADLSLVVVSERLNLLDILSLDSDFDIYKRLGNNPFNRLPLYK